MNVRGTIVRITHNKHRTSVRSTQNVEQLFVRSFVLCYSESRNIYSYISNFNPERGGNSYAENV